MVLVMGWLLGLVLIIKVAAWDDNDSRYGLVVGVGSHYQSCGTGVGCVGLDP